MKLNLAALPKPDARRIWMAGFHFGFAANSVAEQAMQRGASPTDAHLGEILRLAAMLDAVPADPTNLLETGFNRWWSEQTGQGETG